MGIIRPSYYHACPTSRPRPNGRRPSPATCASRSPRGTRRSTPVRNDGKWFFLYTIVITNEGTDTVQLISRHWIITDAENRVEEVRGLGVIGQQPILEPGESFEYTSGCPLTTPFGSMSGSYQMKRADGGTFDIEVAPFALTEPYTIVH